MLQTWLFYRWLDPLCLPFVACASVIHISPTSREFLLWQVSQLPTTCFQNHNNLFTSHFPHFAKRDTIASHLSAAVGTCTTAHERPCVHISTLYGHRVTCNFTHRSPPQKCHIFLRITTMQTLSMAYWIALALPVSPI